MMELAEAHRQQVGIGEVKIGASSDVLQAIVGSCVGIAFIWKRRGRCALAHCLLPEAPGQPCGLGARYVSQAIPSMLALMGAHQCDYADIEVIVVGGASMFKGRSQCLQVGQANAAAAQKYLAQCGLNVVYCDLGGRSGRQISIDCEQQSFLVKEIVRH
jgi:chemotaxis protein CheD